MERWSLLKQFQTWLQAELANLMDFDKAVEWHKAQAQLK
jgi:hypothetical protein